MQQVEEGWFADLGQVPMRAISMSVGQILKSKEIMALVPGSRKALAVKVCVEHGISPTAPASILRTHGNTTMYLDRDSAAQLSLETDPAGKLDIRRYNRQDRTAGINICTREDMGIPNCSLDDAFCRRGLLNRPRRMRCGRCHQLGVDFAHRVPPRRLGRRHRTDSQN